MCLTAARPRSMSRPDQTGPVSYGISKLAGEVATLNANRAQLRGLLFPFSINGGNCRHDDPAFKTQKQVLVV